MNPDTRRLQSEIAAKRGIAKELSKAISDLQQQITSLQGDRSRVGQDHHAYERIASVDGQIRRHRSSVDAYRRQIGSIEIEIRGLEAELRSRRDRR